MPVVCKSPKRNNWVGTTLIITMDDDIPIYLQLTYFLRRLCNCRSNLESDVSWAKVKDFWLKPPRVWHFVFFNVNEQLAAIFQTGQGYGFYELSLFLLFMLDYLSEHSHIYTGLILLTTQNLQCYLLFAFCLFVLLIQPKYVSHPSH